MKRWLLIGALGVLCAGVLDVTAQPPAKRGTWHSNYETARVAARQSGKPMMVVFRCER